MFYDRARLSEVRGLLWRSPRSLFIVLTTPPRYKGGINFARSLIFDSARTSLPSSSSSSSWSVSKISIDQEDKLNRLLKLVHEESRLGCCCNVTKKKKISDRKLHRWCILKKVDYLYYLLDLDLFLWYSSLWLNRNCRFLLPFNWRRSANKNGKRERSERAWKVSFLGILIIGLKSFKSSLPVNKRKNFD